MLNENHNYLHWKDKLEDEGSLPGERLKDKNAAWEKLHNRLHKKPKEKRMLWYWTAAACLIPGMLILIMLSHIDNSSLVKNPVRKEVETKPIVKETEPKEKDAVAVTSISPVLKERTVKKEIERKSNSAITEITTETSDANHHKDMTDNEMISPVTITDSPTVTIVAVVPAKKKLKVVHINELGEPMDVFPDMARNTALHPFPLQLANEEVYINSLASHAKGFTIIKTKSSSN